MKDSKHYLIDDLEQNYLKYSTEEINSIIDKTSTEIIAQYGSFDLNKFLLNKKESTFDGKKCAKIAISNGNIRLVKYYLSIEASNYTFYFMYCVIESGNLDLFKYCYENYEYVNKSYLNTNLNHSCQIKNLDILKFLIEKNKDIIKKSETEPTNYIIHDMISYSVENPKASKYLYSLYPSYFSVSIISSLIFTYLNQNNLVNISWILNIFLNVKKSKIERNEFTFNDLDLEHFTFGEDYNFNIFYSSVINCDIEIIKYVYDIFKKYINSEKDTIITKLILSCYKDKIYYNIKKIDKSLIYVFKLLDFPDYKKYSKDTIHSVLKHLVCNYRVGLCYYLSNKYKSFYEDIDFSNIINKTLIDEVAEYFEEHNTLPEFFRFDFYKILKFILKLQPDIYINSSATSQYCSIIKLKYCKKIMMLFRKKNNLDRLDIYKIVENICIEGNINKLKWLNTIFPGLESKLDYEYNEETPFSLVCENGHLNFAKFILKKNPSIDISFNNYYAFNYACENDHLEIAKWLYEKENSINISDNNEYLFANACYTNSSKIVKWLLEIKPDINYKIENNKLFKYVCQKNFISIAKILVDINPNYTIKLINNEFINDYFINFDFDIIGSKLVETKQKCCVCYEEEELLTKCNHSLCNNCLKNIKSMFCPYCRQEFTEIYTIVQK